MSLSRAQRRGAVIAALAASTATALVLVSTGPASVAVPHNLAYREHAKPEVGGADSEGGEIATALANTENARLAPYGSVPAGQLGTALTGFKGLTGNSSTWDEVTNLPYNADDPGYRDPNFSNSSGGAGFVAGRITGLAAGNGYLFAGGANGGVFRKKLPDGTWEPISDSILSLSTGDLEYDAANDVLWYATGEANTGATSYTGAGVYRLANATTSTFTDADRVGGSELESRGINKVRFDDKNHWVYAATTRGLWRHSTTDLAGAWDNVLMPNPSDDGNISKPYNNIVNDVAIQPGTGKVMANAAWRSGAAYNGFYESPDGSANSFVLVNPTGALPGTDVGNTEFAFSKDGSKLYALVEDPRKLTNPQSALNGVFVSPNGTLEGPWNRIATSSTLGKSGSALFSSNGRGYSPGIQAWYNNFVAVDPGNPQHVYVGLEEVYETTDGGNHWTVPGPYWNFGFPCWNIIEAKNKCAETTHSDQHSIAIDNNVVYVGNDGGVKSRPLDPAASKEDSQGHATDWTDQSVGLRTLQYYSVGVGKDIERGGFAVAGGLQDNGGSLIRGDGKMTSGDAGMVSPFGGDGGDIIVDPKNGCHILDEYVYLELWMTTNCGATDGSTSAVFDVGVPDSNPRFTAPFRAVRGSQNTADGASERWVAGGNSVWAQDKAFGYTKEEAAADSSHGWQRLFTHGGAGRMTVGLDAIADKGDPTNHAKDVVYAAWCGNSNCNSSGFTRGVATNYGGTWNELDMTGLPNRYPSAVYIDDQADAKGGTVYLVFNGYNRRFIEGPGSGTKHVFKGVVGAVGADGTRQVAWTDISGNMPDVPATDVLRVGDKLVVGTDYGVLVSGLDGGTWQRVGGTPGEAGALPLTTVFDIHVGPDGFLYAATHGRGIWKTPVASL